MNWVTPSFLHCFNNRKSYIFFWQKNILGEKFCENYSFVLFCVFTLFLPILAVNPSNVFIVYFLKIFMFLTVIVMGRTGGGTVGKPSCSLTFEQRGQIGVDSDRAHGCILSDWDFQKETRNTNQKQHERIGNQKRSAAMFEAKIRKPPDISKSCKSKRSIIKIFINKKWHLFLIIDIFGNRQEVYYSSKGNLPNFY